MPFSPDNPQRNRNFAFAILGAVFVFAVVMTAYVTLSIAGRDTDQFLRFLTLVITGLVPATVAVFRSNAAAHHAQQTRSDVAEVKKAVNGDLETTVQRAVRTELRKDHGE